MGGYREHGKEPEALEVCVWQEGGMHAAALEAFCNLLTSAWTGGGGEKFSTAWMRGWGAWDE